jgi:hypothetical protein
MKTKVKKKKRIRMSGAFQQQQSSAGVRKTCINHQADPTARRSRRSGH